MDMKAESLHPIHKVPDCCGYVSRGGMNLSRWAVLDGTGRKARNGLNFVSGRGYCARAGYSDQGNTESLQLRRGAHGWKSILSAEFGSRRFTLAEFLPHYFIRCLPLQARARSADRHASHDNALQQFQIRNIQEE